MLTLRDRDSNYYNLVYETDESLCRNVVIEDHVILEVLNKKRELKLLIPTYLIGSNIKQTGAQLIEIGSYRILNFSNGTWFLDSKNNFNLINNYFIQPGFDFGFNF